MAHKMAQMNHPNDHRNNYEELASNLTPEALQRRRRLQCLAIIIAAVVLKVVIIGVLVLTVFRFKGPEISLHAVTIENLSVFPGTPTRFNVQLREEILINNQNLGEFKYDNTEAVLSYAGTKIGEDEIPSGHIKMKRKRVVVVSIEAKFEGLLTDADTNKGILTVNSCAMLSGKVNMMMTRIKKRRTGEMNCTVMISSARQVIQDYYCR